MMIRCSHNPIITPEAIPPTREGFRVEGTFNAGITNCGGEILMLVRVAERLLSSQPGEIRISTLEKAGDTWELTARTIGSDDLQFDTSDPRAIVSKVDSSTFFLTSMSHLRLARSADGIRFQVDEAPFLFPATRYERLGCEDARITPIDGRFYINYTAVSDLGIATALAVTDDFSRVERLGLIFAPDNRDVCLFPRKIGGFYWALHRPAPFHYGAPQIWLAKSTDLLHWGDHRILAERTTNRWESLKIGGGSQMIETDRGWLQIYHGVDQDQRYCLGALLLALDDPSHVVARLPVPLLEPLEPYERSGFFDNVVFSCGALLHGSELHVYYGAADRVTALATVPLPKLWQAMGV